VAAGAASGYAASELWDKTIGEEFKWLKEDLGKHEDAAQMRGLASDKMNLGSDPDKVLADTHAKYLEFIKARKDKEKADADKKVADAKTAAAQQPAAAQTAARQKAESEAAAKKLAETKVVVPASPSPTTTASAVSAPPPPPPASARPPIGMVLRWGPLPEGMICYPGMFKGTAHPELLSSQGHIDLTEGAALCCVTGTPGRGSYATIEIFISKDTAPFPTLAEFAARAKARDPHGDFHFVRHTEATLGGVSGYLSVGDGGIRGNRFFFLNLLPDGRIVADILCEIGPGNRNPEGQQAMLSVLEAALATLHFEPVGP
jgi:hypothetical protein